MSQDKGTFLDNCKKDEKRPYFGSQGRVQRQGIDSPLKVNPGHQSHLQPVLKERKRSILKDSLKDEQHLPSFVPQKRVLIHRRFQMAKKMEKSPYARNSNQGMH